MVCSVSPEVNIVEPPRQPDFVHLPEGAPRFLVTIDTEEEFDWSRPPRREGHGLETIGQFGRFQEFCNGFGVVPVFLIDHPIATAPETAAVLGPALAEGKAEVGIHLHPWVNPPFVEEVSDFNSFAGNLPFEIEREKFLGLHATIKANLGVAPLIYRAGRYGVGPNSAAILREAGVVIDTSVRSLYEYTAIGGPDFRRHPRRAYWLDRARSLIEAPVTAAFTGHLQAWGQTLYPLLGRVPRLLGAMARIGLLERIPLSPEGTTVDEGIRAIDAALADDQHLLIFSFHSPSLAPGHTPYVRDTADLEAFYDWWRAIFAHLARRGVAPTTVQDLTRSLALA
ncbi:polysaccharide deacetylase family protein [Novosphingobium sp. JCM 18896]|uniref:polysaccharide deacetylase family protein n=1 Tax=Novosphingobium sp. JCM 18896 TaxID=2989731 RepID=UPI0022232F4A|nr:polysaccharide deacetylase family protein [Novosphingobium sp. JCM 18896]MCW1428043.1 polysaccharide deacetylase family protein [Novosphingobium sp. JCM 18896]